MHSVKGPSVFRSRLIRVMAGLAGNSGISLDSSFRLTLLPWVCRISVFLPFFLILLVFPDWSWAQGDMARVIARTYSGSLNAYARVEPLGSLSLVASADGVVSGLTVMPGDRVRAGEILVRLSGPEIQAMQVGAKADVADAEAALQLARHTYRIKTTLYGEHLVTLLEVHQARTQISLARARLSSALAQGARTEAAGRVRAPMDATVERIRVVNGARVSPGETLVQLQPESRLWLVAMFYGGKIGQVKPGMLATFLPADGRAAIRVRVHGLLPMERPDGGIEVGLIPLKPPFWLNGESGTLKLSLPSAIWPAVPTPALILDQGHWWVLVSGKNGIHPVRVEPGPAMGNLTLIRQGLKVGDRVVIHDAYLRFHKELGSTYQSPD